MSVYLPEDTPREAFCLMEGHEWRGGSRCVRCGERLRCECGRFVTEDALPDHIDRDCPVQLDEAA